MPVVRRTWVKKHGAELAGADQADADRSPGGFALGEFGVEIHEFDLPIPLLLLRHYSRNAAMPPDGRARL